MRKAFEEIIDSYEKLFLEEDMDMIVNETGNSSFVENYNYNHGASKVVIDFDDCVLKIPISGCWIDEPVSFDNQNYCIREVALYRKAKKEGVADFFLKSRLINNFFEIQEKGEVECVPIPAGTLEEIYNCFSNYASQTLSSIVMTILKLYYSQEEIDKFCDFIEKYEINDLSYMNMCMKNGKPVFMDFCGFSD